ncbi:MAG: acyltransferase family protein [Bergeyella sp.]
MKFRNDISFLRALSVLVVMFFHFQVPYFSGGFIGVDVFFVISGFLMTQIILKGIENNTFSLKTFYVKRINRIIPALLVLLGFVLLISVVFFFKSDIRLNAKYVFLSEFFVSNIYYWKYTDYFTSHDNILLHTWSLGVEWQFYLLYPLLILLLRKIYLKRKNLFWGIITGITGLSFLLMIVTTSIDNNFAFYMLPSRFWELSVGGLAFFMSQKITLPKTIKSILVLISVLAILLSVTFISSSILWPSWYTIIPVFATVLILILNLDTPVFDAKPIKFFGDISYSLYLWHWPWFVFFQYFGFIEKEHTIILSVISIICAFLSYRFIESKKSVANLKFVIVLSLVIAMISAVLFFKTEIVNPLSIYRNEKFEIGNYGNLWLESGKDKQFNPCNCFQTIKDYDFKKCLTIEEGKKNVLLIGDSHSAQFSEALREKESFHLLEASTGYAFPFLDARGKIENKPVMDYVFKEFIPANHHKINLVIISAIG